MNLYIKSNRVKIGQFFKFSSLFLLAPLSNRREIHLLPSPSYPFLSCGTLLLYFCRMLFSLQSSIIPHSCNHLIFFLRAGENVASPKNLLDVFLCQLFQSENSLFHIYHPLSKIPSCRRSASLSMSACVMSIYSRNLRRNSSRSSSLCVISRFAISDMRRSLASSV